MPLSAWSSFFSGELGAAAALTGLLFVAVSVNQARILELGRMADRGLEGLVMLFLALVIASLPLMPGQSFRVLGGEIFAIATLTLAAVAPLQKAYVEALEPQYRPRSATMVRINQTAMGVIALGGLLVLWRGDGVGLYMVGVGILLTFLAAGANAWVLLIEINR
jgi:modulator of FtsH protease